MKKPPKLSDELVEEAYITMAQIIRDHGDKFLPVFQRIHEIREQRKAKRDLKNIALQIASISAP
jgi:hypothetical protein